MTESLPTVHHKTSALRYDKTLTLNRGWRKITQKNTKDWLKFSVSNCHLTQVTALGFEEQVTDVIKNPYNAISVWQLRYAIHTKIKKTTNKN